GSNGSIQEHDRQANAEIKITEQQILQQYANQGKVGSSYFEHEFLRRNEQWSKQSEQWLQVLNDTTKNEAAIDEALAAIQQLEGIQSRITSLEEELNKDFRNVIVTKVDNEKWK